MSAWTAKLDSEVPEATNKEVGTVSREVSVYHESVSRECFDRDLLDMSPVDGSDAVDENSDFEMDFAVLPYEDRMRLNQPAPVYIPTRYEAKIDLEPYGAPPMLSHADQDVMASLIDLCERMVTATSDTQLAFLCAMVDFQFSFQSDLAANAETLEYIVSFTGCLDPCERGLLAAAFCHCDDEYYQEPFFYPDVPELDPSALRALHAVHRLPKHLKGFALCTLWRCQWLMLTDVADSGARGNVLDTLAEYVWFNTRAGGTMGRGALAAILKAVADTDRQALAAPPPGFPAKQDSAGPPKFEPEGAGEAVAESMTIADKVGAIKDMYNMQQDWIKKGHAGYDWALAELRNFFEANGGDDSILAAAFARDEQLGEREEEAQRTDNLGVVFVDAFEIVPQVVPNPVMCLESPVRTFVDIVSPITSPRNIERITAKKLCGIQGWLARLCGTHAQ
jgi:hypothetical protein